MPERPKSKKAQDAGIVLLIASLADRPRTMTELNALMTRQNIPPAQRPALRRAWATGAAVFFIADIMLFASRDKTISRDFMMGQFETTLSSIADDMRDLARQLNAGRISLDEFQRRVATLIEAAHWAAGFAMFGPALWLYPAVVVMLREMVERQLMWLRRLVMDIRLGRQRLDGSLVRRIALYAGSSWSALVEFNRYIARRFGYTEEMNVLGVAEHCQGCLDETAKGWVPIGTLVPIGSRTCLSNCRCRYEFR